MSSVYCLLEKSVMGSFLRTRLLNGQFLSNACMEMNQLRRSWIRYLCKQTSCISLMMDRFFHVGFPDHETVWGNHKLPFRMHKSWCLHSWLHSHSTSIVPVMYAIFHDGNLRPVSHPKTEVARCGHGTWSLHVFFHHCVYIYTYTSSIYRPQITWRVLISEKMPAPSENWSNWCQERALQDRPKRTMMKASHDEMILISNFGDGLRLRSLMDWFQFSFWYVGI